MGGYAYFFTGELDQRHLDEAKSQKGFFDKLFNKILNPRGEQHIEITSQEFRHMQQTLVDDLISWFCQN